MLCSVLTVGAQDRDDTKICFSETYSQFSQLFFSTQVKGRCFVFVLSGRKKIFIMLYAFVHGSIMPSQFVVSFIAGPDRTNSN